MSLLKSADEVRGGRKKTAGQGEDAPGTKSSEDMETSSSLGAAEQQDTGETVVGGDTDETATGFDWTVTGVTLDEIDEEAPASEDSAISLSSREASERTWDWD